MRTGTLLILLAAGAALASAANAQEAPSFMNSDPPTVGAEVNPGKGPASWDGDAWRYTHLFGANNNPLRAGFNALEAKNFARAETVFARIVRRDRKNAVANFYLGATRMGLGKWEDAKKHLEIAARKIPKHPDPKSRLGVTYAKLGDIAGANAQRAELVKMADDCKGACELSPYIMGGIQMIDEALAEPPLSSP